MNQTGYEDQIVADYYDYAPPLQSVNDIDFYVKHAKQIRGNVLELGCGTGRVLIPTSKVCNHITGLDLSTTMLKRCKDKISQLSPEMQSKIELIEGNFASFNLDKTLDLITVPFRAFHHLISVNEQLSCLECVQNHLKPNGLFILDLYNPVLQRLLDEKSAEAMFEEPEITLPDGRKIKRVQSNRSPNPNLQTIESKHVYTITEANGEQNTFTTTHPMRYFFRYEIEHLLARCGFEIEAVLSDFQETPFDDFKPGEMIFLSRKST